MSFVPFCFSNEAAPEPRSIKLLEVTIGATTHFDEKLLGLELPVIANVSNSDGNNSQAVEKSMLQKMLFLQSLWNSAI